MSLAGILVSSLLFAQASTPTRARNDLPALFARLRYGVVQVGVLKTSTSQLYDLFGWAGTGFLVDSECTFATAKHVIKGFEDRLVISWSAPQDGPGRTRLAKASLVHVHEERDLAFLRLNALHCKDTSIPALPIRARTSLSELAGESALVIGYPKLSTADKPVEVPVVRHGIVASVEIDFIPPTPAPRTRIILLDLLGAPGFSGSPVILQRSGEVFGVVRSCAGNFCEAGFATATPLYFSEYLQGVGKGREATVTPTIAPK